MGSKDAMDLGISQNVETENNCVICERGPIKYRYNRIVAACVNCQWFYRHHRGKNNLARCAFSKNCKIHYENIQCQFCRFQKCLKVGMARYDPQNQNPNEELKCQFCDFSTFSYAKLDLHVKSTEENREKYACHICKTPFCSRKLLLLHKAKHGGKLFKCQVCEKSFVRKYELTAHMMSHVMKQPPFECPSCDSSFSEFKNFENHILDIHKESGCMQCKICKVSFTSLRKLQLHFVPKNCKMAEKTVFPESIMKILSDASARLAELDEANPSNQVSAASKVKNTRKRRREKLKKLMLELENEKAEKSKIEENEQPITSNMVCPNLDEILQLLSQSFEHFQNTSSEDLDPKELSFFDFLVQEESLRQMETENSRQNSVNPESQNLNQIEDTTPRTQNPKSRNVSKSTIFSFREVLKNSEQRKNTTAPIQKPALKISNLASFNLDQILTPQNSQSSDQSENTKPVLKTSNVVYPDLEEILQLLSQSFEQFQNTSSKDQDPKELSFFDFLVQEENLGQMETENSEENSVQSANSSFCEILEIQDPCKSTTAPIQKPALETSKSANFNMSRFLTPQNSQSSDQSENTKTSPQVSAPKAPEVLDPKEMSLFDFMVEQENSASSQNLNKDTTPQIEKPAPTMNPQNSDGPILEFSKDLDNKRLNKLLATVTQSPKPSELDLKDSKQRNELNNEKRRKLD